MTDKQIKESVRDITWTIKTLIIVFIMTLMTQFSFAQDTKGHFEVVSWYCQQTYNPEYRSYETVLIPVYKYIIK